MASAWETIRRDRRQEPRHKVSLRASVSVIGESHGVVVLAHTRDISRDGLGLVLPSYQLGPHNLGEGDHSVLIVLGLPAGDSVRIEGRLAHCLPAKEKDPTAGCLAGFQITGLSEEDRVTYYDFIASL
jgi:hypothetical protein